MRFADQKSEHRPSSRSKPRYGIISPSFCVAPTQFDSMGNRKYVCCANGLRIIRAPPWARKSSVSFQRGWSQIIHCVASGYIACAVFGSWSCCKRQKRCERKEYARCIRCRCVNQDLFDPAQHAAGAFCWKNHFSNQPQCFLRGTGRFVTSLAC
jgi:hypothetical protein